jgi:hypothetical protein
MVDNRGAAHHAATTPDSSHYTKGAPGTYTSRRGAAFQPRCREGRWNDCRRCAGVPRERAVSPPRIELSSTLSARPPPSRIPPSPPARRGARAVPPRVRPAPCLRPGAGMASPRCRDSHARSCARGVLAWRRRSGLSGKGRSCADGAMPWGPPGSLYLHLCRVEQGWRPLRWPPTLAQTVQVTTAHESDEPII